MDFQSERTVINFLSDTIIKSGVSLYNAVKYIYSMTEDDFYNCNISDVFKIVINNLTNSDCLKSYGLVINAEKCGAMNQKKYDNVLHLIEYSLAIRIPTLKNVVIDKQTMSDAQLKIVYDTVISKGADNYCEYIDDTYDSIKKLVKRKKEVPFYTSEFFRNYIYANVHEIAQMNNRNIFLYGAVEILFPMFYAKLEETLVTIIHDAEKL